MHFYAAGGSKFLLISPHLVPYDYSRANWDGLHNHLRGIPWKKIFELKVPAATSKFCEQVQVGIDVYISHHKCQVKPHSYPWFSAACVAAIVQRNHFFRLYQQNSESKAKFRQASNPCKRVLEAAKLAYANKTKESITSQKLGSQDFWQIANSVLNKGKSATPPLFNSQRCYLIKQNCLLKNILITLILMTQVSLYVFSVIELRKPIINHSFIVFHAHSKSNQIVAH